MSRKGVGSNAPFFTIRIRPICSTMNSRPEPSAAPVTYTGFWRPAVILVNLKELLSGLGPLGVASDGVEGGVGAGVEAVGVGLAGEACEVPPEALQAEMTHATRSTADSLRTLRQV
jgi:hypothetical protein